MKKGGILKNSLILLIIFILCIVVISVSVFADDANSSNDSSDDIEDFGVTLDDGTYNEAKTYNWLNNNSKNAAAISALSMAILALNDKGYSVANQTALLLSRGNSEVQCWPKGDCNVIDTAYALLALKKVGQDTSKGLTWLNSSLNAASMSGQGKEWQLVLETKQNGTCKIGINSEAAKEFKVEDNKINGKFYISENDLGGFGSKLIPVLDINCGDTFPAGSEIIISLNYNKNKNNIFIVDSSSMLTGKITVPNACFSTKGAGGCDYQSTLIATWALVEMGENVENYGTYLYLESELPSNNAVNLAFLTRTLEKALLDGTNLVASYYINNLANSITASGGWGTVLSSSVAVYALVSTDKSDVVTKGKEYLKSKWNKEGKFGGVEETAWGLIALSGKSSFASGSVYLDPTLALIAAGSIETLCYNDVDDDSDGLIDCDDSDCSITDYCKFCLNQYQDAGETGVNCGGICPIPCEGVGPAIKVESGVINCNDYTDNDGDGLIDCYDSDCASECASNLPKEEKCVTDSDCASEEVCTSGMCIKEEASGSSAWLIILIILIVLGGGGAFFYLYFVKSGKFKFKGKSSGSSFDSYKMTRPLPSGPVIPPVKKPVQTVMPRPVFSAPKKVQDDELEKSLKRAEELLFKK